MSYIAFQSGVGPWEYASKSCRISGISEFLNGSAVTVVRVSAWNILFKNRNAYLVCLRIELLLKKIQLKMKFIVFQFAMIQVKVHDFNTLIVQEKVQSLGILWLSDTHISGECVLLKNLWLPGISQARIRSSYETTRAHLQGCSLCLKHVSLTRSECVCLGLSLATWKAREEFEHCCWWGTVCCGTLYRLCWSTLPYNT